MDHVVEDDDVDCVVDVAVDDDADGDADVDDDADRDDDEEDDDWESLLRPSWGLPSPYRALVQGRGCLAAHQGLQEGAWGGGSAHC
eukprot:11155105-Lingulodinium_polyedra.AAC.1